jgi:hypothetical protein
MEVGVPPNGRGTLAPPQRLAPLSFLVVSEPWNAQLFSPLTVQWSTADSKV